jgi:hypothetical protein
VDGSSARRFPITGAAEPAAAVGSGGADAVTTENEDAVVGVHALLQRLCAQDGSSQASEVQAWLIDGAVSHSFSGASQTCGYRCAQMILSHVLAQDNTAGWPGSRSRLGPLPPSVESLRCSLEEAWQAGYDPSGAAQLHHSTVKRQRRDSTNSTWRATNSIATSANQLKWIGGTEIWVLLSHFGLSARLVDFALPSAFTRTPNAPPQQGARTLPRRPGAELFSWLWDYFAAHPTAGDSGWPRRSRAPPAVLQYSGHSLVVIGALRRRLPTGGEERRLLILDPGLGPAELQAQLAGGGLSRVGLLIEAHDRDAYQLVTVAAGWRESRSPREPDECTRACVCGEGRGKGVG